MPLARGTTLGHYEIRELIGKGGMGEVYLGFDEELKRDVAIKLLPEAFARDPERIARFKREAQLLASLNHANIAAIYGLVEAGAAKGLVMEYVPGETLADRVRREGPVPLDETLEITKQVCEALEHAHEKTIIHRDLKPANVKLTPVGQVKVLDFGLAKAFTAVPESGDPGDSPTLSAMPTLPGVILGTAAYMSPEQARGRKVDKRTDVWALGCVLYELLTGRGAFYSTPSRHQSRARQQADMPSPAKGPLPHRRFASPESRVASPDEPDTVQEIIANILKGEPDWALLPANTPPHVRMILRRSLQKDPAKRLRSAADIAISIEEGGFSAAPPATAPRVAHWRLAAMLGVAVVLASLASLFLKPAAPPTAQAPVHVTITLPAGDVLAESTTGGANRPLAYSPDGSHIAYVATRGGNRQIFLRALSDPQPRPIAGTEGASAPFFSPDGQWIGFFAQGKLKKVSITGGAPVVLCDAGTLAGAAWAPDGTIIFSPSTTSPLMRVSADGGTPEAITALDRSNGESSHRNPQVLSGAKVLLFNTMGGAGWDDYHVIAQVLASGDRRVLVRGAHTASYAPSGHLIYARAQTLLAVPFDLDRLEVTSQSPVSIVEAVRTSNLTAAEYSVSSNGSLAYIGTHATLDRRLVWVDRAGNVEAIPLPPRRYAGPVLSPDGRQAALGIQSNTDDLWLYDLERGTLSKLTSEGTSQEAVWSPDGKQIAYRAYRRGFRNVFWRSADGTGTEEQLTEGESQQTPSSWSPDGKAIAYTVLDPSTGTDLWWLPLEGNRKAQVFLRTTTSENEARFSPDGRWLAYSSNESGRNEIFVQPFPGPGRKWQVSTNGGSFPLWNPNGRELFYRSGDRMMAVDITTAPTFSAGQPRQLFEARSLAISSVSPDGQRFLATQPVEPEQPATQINVVLNWFEELKRRVPAAR
ncbi:MAG: protein kinase [Acidobacteria bacterium]|nr:protein kinase [Acidobacteriota bacterium]